MTGRIGKKVLGRKKKIAIVALLIAVIILGLIAVYLFVPRGIKMYEEYQIYDGRELEGVGWKIIHSEKSRQILLKKFNLKIPEVDFNKYYLLWSSGRRMKKITYRMISKYKWRYGVPKGIASFGEEYYPHTAFFYKINKVHLKQDWVRRDELLKQRDERRGKQDENQK